MSAPVVIGGRPVGLRHPPLIVAEMSGNHNQSLSLALEIVDAAAQAGAHVLKLQTYTADTITLDVRRDEFVVSDAHSLWNGRNSLYELYKQAYTPWEWHAPIMQRAQERGMLCFSSPFDETAVDFLEELDVPAYKIASFENNTCRSFARSPPPASRSSCPPAWPRWRRWTRRFALRGKPAVRSSCCSSARAAIRRRRRVQTF